MNDPQLSSDLYYIGDIAVFPFDRVAQDFLRCDGSLLSRESYPGLFGVIGYTFGGDYQDHFNLPDLRGYSPVGVTEYNYDRNSALNSGIKLGTETVVLKPANLPVHSHTASLRDCTVPFPVSQDLATEAIPTDKSMLAQTANDRGVDVTIYSNSQVPASSQLLISTFNDGSFVNSGQTGGTKSVQNMQPFLGVGFHICFDGPFPPEEDQE